MVTMKRFRRAVAIFLSLTLFAGVTAFVGVIQDDSYRPESIQSFAEMCD